MLIRKDTDDSRPNAAAWESGVIRTREASEIDRSRREAAKDAPRGKVGARQIRRYLNPSSETSYPLEFAFHLLGDVRDKRILEIGSGTGTNAILLAAKGANVVGLDISPPCLAIAQKRMTQSGSRRIPLVAGSAHALPVATGSVDVVFGVAVLHHLEIDVACREFHRVLRPGGRAIFQEPVRTSKALRYLRAAIPYTRANVSEFEHPLTADELAKMARLFRWGRQRAFWLPHVNVTQRIPVTRNHAHKIHLLDRALLRRFPSLQRFAGIRVFELLQESPNVEDELAVADSACVGRRLRAAELGSIPGGTLNPADSSELIEASHEHPSSRPLAHGR